MLSHSCLVILRYKSYSMCTCMCQGDETPDNASCVVFLDDENLFEDIC